VVQKDGAKIYCDIVYFGEQNVSIAAMDINCTGATIYSNDFNGVVKPIQVPVDAITA
jgi:hypothetical protein